MKKLKKGYTTGVHTSFAFRSALELYLVTKKLSTSKTNKMNNDDLDVTKGCEIVVTISDNRKDLKLNRIKHKPHIFENREGGRISIFAGKGVGVVTKKGLKVEREYPAINPTPLKVLREIFLKKRVKEELFCAISVSDGEELAKKTANSKVGVLGGISILGTTGFVKPVSSEAYLKSIETEIEFAIKNGYSEIYFTIGNNSLKRAKERGAEEQIVEIGNYIYASLKIAKELRVKRVILFAGIGKLTKLSQGFKNSHNRFGSIDFKLIQSKIKENFNYQIDITSITTIKGVTKELGEIKPLFYNMIKSEAEKVVKSWFRELNIEIVIVE